MTSEVAAPSHTESPPSGLTLPSWWVLAAALVVLAVPTVINLAGQTWQLESGAHGPIVLSTGAWLLYHDGMRLSAVDPAGQGWRRAWPFLLLSLAAYIFGRAFDFISLEYAGLYGAFLSMVLRLIGWSGLKRHAFPLFYLALAVPPPGWLMTAITAPLQTIVSQAAEWITALLGYPVARQGVMLFVGPYQLLVEEACSGLNSLFGLVAISTLYIYLMHRASFRYAMVLLVAVLPIAVAANIIRIMALILITWHFGDAAAQGFLHATTGMVLFTLGLLMVFAVDRLLEPLFRKRKVAA